MESIKSNSTRRSQGERTEQMRERLIEATLDCIAEEGYASTTVSRIIETAHTSRGAFLHHFPNKSLLIEAATLQLAKRLYRLLGEAVATVGYSGGVHSAEESSPAASANSQLEGMILNCWDMLFKTRENLVILELMNASRNDADLAQIMRQLAGVCMEMLIQATHHYFEPRAHAETIPDIMTLTQWVVRGMAADAHLLREPGEMRKLLIVWCRILDSQMKPRRGVCTPPPKPKMWNTWK
ncbi:MAG: TetR/AcrR family transcriptional regulator [Limnobacter sp.]|nr:TetR/AcrR family transcriptional regulator [Limnobacter sp.]